MIAILLFAAGFQAAGYSAGVALPIVLQSIGGMAYYSLINALATLSMMLAMPLTGKLSELFGIKTVILFGIILQTISRLGLLVTQSLPPLMTLYAFSNMGIGFYISGLYTVISDVVEETGRPKYFGLFTTFMAIGSLAGPLAAGQLLNRGFTQIVFIVYLPFFILGLPFFLALYPNRKPPGTGSGQFDWMGIVLLIVGVSALVSWLSLGGSVFPWLSPAGLGLAVLAAVGIWLMVVLESRHPNPTVPIKVFRCKKFTSSFLVSMLTTSFFTTMAAFAIVYAQQVMRVSPAVSATVTMPQTLAQAVFGVVFGRVLSTKFQKRFRPIALLAQFLILAATFLLLLARPDTPILVILAASALGGIGVVVPQSSLMPFFMSDLDPRDYGAGISMFNFAGSLGSCLYMAAAGTLLNMTGSLESCFRLAFAFCAAAMCVAFLGFRYTSNPKTDL
jgi:MFS family permease